MSIDLDDYALKCISHAVPDYCELDPDALHKYVQKEVQNAAIAVCYYDYDCEDIIRLYEGKVQSSDAKALADGAERFRMVEWRRSARAEYASAIAYAYLSAAIMEMLEKVRVAASALATAAGKEIDHDKPMVSPRQPFFPFRQDREDGQGIQYCSKKTVLQDRRAVRIRVAEVWLSYDLTPSEA